MYYAPPEKCYHIKLAVLLYLYSFFSICIVWLLL